MPNEPFPVEKPAVLKASTPGGHPIIRAAWRIAFALLIGSAMLYALRSFIYPLPAILALGLFAAGFAAYLVRHARFLGTLARGANYGGGRRSQVDALLGTVAARHGFDWREHDARCSEQCGQGQDCGAEQCTPSLQSPEPEYTDQAGQSCHAAREDKRTGDRGGKDGQVAQAVEDADDGGGG